MLESFKRRQETEVMRIPKELRNMKMKDINTMWGGNWGATLQKLRQMAMENRDGEQEVDVVVKVEEMRKRWVHKTVWIRNWPC
jgi:hypothetical protein